MFCSFVGWTMNHKIRPMFLCHIVQAEIQPLCNLTEYIQEQWIDSIILLPTDRNVFKQPIQTHNDMEGCHNALNCRAGGKCRLEFYLIIKLLHRESHLTYIPIQLISDKKLKWIQRKSTGNFSRNCSTPESSTRPAIKTLHNYSPPAPTWMGLLIACSSVHVKCCSSSKYTLLK